MIHRILQLPKEKHFFLLGPRMTGKSTLIRQTFSGPDTLYIDLLNNSEYLRYSRDPGQFYHEVIGAVSQGKKHVIIDEIQRIPDLLNEVHRLIEEKHDLQFILSGSSARKLKRFHANMLAGRAFTFHLHPLTLKEMGPDANLIHLLKRGGLPAIYLEKDEKFAQEMLRSYVETYLSEEIKQESLIRNLGAFFRFLPLAGEESGTVVNFSNLSRQIGISYKTIQEYYQILVDTWLGFFLPAYASSVRKNTSSHPKFYFFDTAVVRAIRHQLTLQLETGTRLFGDYFEMWVIAELFRWNDYQRLDCRLGYYRTHSGIEVDCILERPDHRLTAIEIKARNHIDRSDLKGLHHFKEHHPEATLYVISTVPRVQQIDQVTLLPYTKLTQVFE